MSKNFRSFECERNMRITSCLTIAAAALAAASYAQAEIATYRLDQVLPSGAGAPPEFGMSVATDGDRIVITVPNTPSHLYSVADIYVRGGVHWNGEGALSYNHLAVDAGSYLPCNGIALSDDVLAIGVADAPGGDGKVFLGKRNGAAWVYTFNSLTAPTPSVYERFGCSVALSEGRLLVSAPGHSWTGGGYIFIRQSDDTWALQAELTAAGASKNDAVGLSAGLDGDLAVLGAPHADSDKGAVFVFKRSGSNWTQVKKLAASSGAAGDQFGASVAISNGTIVVGAPEQNSGQGAVYVFAGATYVEQPFLTSPLDKNFGSAVAISGDRLVVGAIGGGGAYAYTRSGSQWYERGLLLRSTSDSRLGGSVAISGTTAVVGAMGVNSAYVLHDDQIFGNGYQ